MVFIRLWMTPSEQQLKWPHALSKIFHYFWHLFQLHERTDLNNIYKQSVILSNIYKYVSFAYYQLNYARYVSYQQVYMWELQSIDSNAMMDLARRGFGGLLSSDSFSCLNGDLIKEIFNGKTKRQVGPRCAEFSKNIAKVTTWVATSHFHATVTQNFSDKIQLNTITNHKECTPVAIKLHINNEELLKENLKRYGTDPFETGKASNNTTGNECVTEKSRW